MILNENIKTFIAYIIFFSLKLKILIYLSQKTQIVFLNIKKIYKNILVKYLNFENMFLKE